MFDVIETKKYILNRLKNLAYKLKKILSKSSENDEVYKMLALIYEFLGKHTKSLFFYFKFIERQKNINVFYGRLNFLLCWYPNFRKKTEIISKILFRKNFLYPEILLFYSKYFIQFGKKDFSKIFCRKILFMGKKKEIENLDYKKNSFFSSFFLVNFLERYKILEKKKKKEIKNHFFFVFKSIKFNENKVLYISFNNIIRYNNFLNWKRNNLYFFFKNLNFEQNSGLPIILRKLKKNIKVGRKVPSFFIINNIINSIKQNFKWFSCLVVLFPKKKKKNYCDIFNSKYFTSNLKKIFQSYNSIFRNINHTIHFLRKVAKFQYKNSMISESLFLYKLIFETNSGHIESLRIISLIKKKLFSDKIGSKIFIKGLKSLIRKKCNLNKKVFAKKKFNFDFLEMAENFFEKKRIYALSNLVLSFMIIKNQKFKNLVKIRKKDEKRQPTDLLQNFSQEKNFFSQIRLLRNTIESEKKNNITLKSFSFISKLENVILLFILKKKLFYKEKILSKLLYNNFFISYGSRFLKTCCIFISIKKEKFEQAYKITRLQCLMNPFSYQSWSLLAKLENKIGIMTSKTLRYSLRILMKNPTSLPAIIFTGNYCSIFGSFGYSLAEFFHAYRWHNGSSFLNFSISLQYINGSSSRKIKNLQFIIFLSLSFFSEYQKLRNFIVQKYFKKNYQGYELEVEVIYNTARLYLFLGYEWLALKTFKKGLMVSYNFLSLTKKRRNFENISNTRINKQIHFNMDILSCCFGIKKSCI